jgi:pyochelin synthetase
MSRHTLPLDRWPWFEVALSLHGNGSARLHWNHNNFFGDGYGTQRLLAEVQQRYDDPGASWPPLTLSYRDCVLALQRIEASALGERARRYWLQRLPALPGPPPVPLRAGNQPRRRSRLQRRSRQLEAGQWQRFQHSARQHGLTASNALFAVQAEVLARWSGTRHFVLNNMVTHRLPLHPQVPEVFGNFASLYPLEVDWREPGSFAQRAQRLQQQVMRDLQHIHCSGTWVLQALSQARKTPGRALCPYVVGSGLFMPAPESPGFSCLETPQVVLDHQFWALQDGRLWAVWDVIEDCFPPGLVDAMWDAHGELLARLADEPQTWQQPHVELLPAVQRERRVAANRTAAPLPEGLLHDGLARSAQRWPQHTALVDPQRRIDYATLHHESQRMAHTLHAAGVQPGDRVAVLLPKGWRQVVGVYGVLRAAAVYVPLDPDWPRQRIEQVLDDVQAVGLICGEGPPHVNPPPWPLRTWRVEECALEDGPSAALSAPPVRQAAGDLAYILFTSGSTGVPKGVMVEHRAALNTVADVLQRFAIGPSDVVFGLSSLCFDLSVFDLFGTLAAGATLVLPGTADGPDPAAWLAAMQSHGVTVWNSVPALMQLLVDAAASSAATLPQLRTVMLSGDWIPLSLPARIAALAPQARTISLGGATEAAIWSICHPIERIDPAWPSIPYGRPMKNQRWHVLHDDGGDSPDGVPGHLCIAGDGLARGYWRDEAKTAAAFVTHPRTGERLYRTGDIGRYLPDGTIELIGRSDLQLKVQGHRIEPGEIEHALRLQPEVEDAVVLAHDSAAGAGRSLVAFVVSAAGRPLSARDLQQRLRQRLPPHMVPGFIRFIDSLPLTPIGKLDRPALQALAGDTDAATPAAVPPRSAQEACIAAVWQEVLGVQDVGVHDDFFERGGTSLAALRAVAEIGRRLGRPVALSALLDGRTVAGLARMLLEPARTPCDAGATGGPGVESTGNS